MENFVELGKLLWENLLFVFISLSIVAVITLVTKLVENKTVQRRDASVARRISIIAVCAALATVLHIFDFPLVFLAPEFYKLDFSELPVLLCGFYLGPSASVVCEVIKIVLKLMIKGTSTAFVGDFANFVVGCCFVLPATFWYHLRRKKGRGNAVIGLAFGTASLAAFGSAFNAFYLIPKFSQLFHLPLEQIISMGGAINANVTDLTTFVLLCVVPLNLVKGAAVSVLTMLLYKHVARPLFGIKR